MKHEKLFKIKDKEENNSRLQAVLEGKITQTYSCLKGFKVFISRNCLNNKCTQNQLALG
jgi:hypothetical protein